MLTLKVLSEETERVVKGLEKKHFPNAREAVEKVLEYDKLRREAQQKLDSNKQQQNQLSKQIGSLMRDGKKEEAEQIKAKVAELKADDKALQEVYNKAQEDMTHELLDIPNIPIDKVPEGKDASSNVVVKTGGVMPDLPQDALCHWDLLKKFNLVDFDLGVKITGAGFPVYIGKMARFQRALEIRKDRCITPTSMTSTSSRRPRCLSPTCSAMRFSTRKTCPSSAAPTQLVSVVRLAAMARTCAA